MHTVIESDRQCVRDLLAGFAHTHPSVEFMLEQCANHIAAHRERELALPKASDEAHWRTLRECADILCLPDESPSLLPEKIRLLQLCANSEKQAKVERGDMLVAEQEKTVKLRVAIEEALRRMSYPDARPACIPAASVLAAAIDR